MSESSNNKFLFGIALILFAIGSIIKVKSIRTKVKSKEKTKKKVSQAVSQMPTFFTEEVLDFINAEDQVLFKSLYKTTELYEPLYRPEL